MNQQALSSPREQHFYVAIANHLFHHPEHGIVSVHDPIKIKDAEQYGLSPLMLYGLTVAGLPIRWMTFTPVDQPRAFRDVLPEAWRSAEGLRGRPDILRINRHLALASPKLVRDMAKIGVRVEIAKNLVACWPNSPAEIAKSAGITLRDLQWFTSGKAPLDRYNRINLATEVNQLG